MKRRSWRDICRERRYHPYKIWLSEIKNQRRGAKDFKPVPLFENQQ